MKTFYLFPYRCKMIGFVLLIIAVLFGITTALMGEPSFLSFNVPALLGSDLGHPTGWLTTVSANISYTLTGVLFIVGGMLVAFAREENEDEYIMQLRLSAFQWSVFANYALLLFVFLAVYGIDFLLVLSYNLYTVIVLFILRFHYLLYANRKALADEK